MPRAMPRHDLLLISQFYKTIKVFNSIGFGFQWPLALDTELAVRNWRLEIYDEVNDDFAIWWQC
jgi:hypothetical protein